MEVRIPNRLFAEHNLAVDDGGDFAIAAPEIEADAATVQVAAERFGHCLARREIARGDDFNRVVVNLLPDQVRVEFAGGRVTEVLLQLLRDGRRTIEVN